MSAPIQYSRGASKYDNQPAQREAANFDDFAAAVLNDRACKKGLIYVCAPFAEGTHNDPDKHPGLKCWRQKQLVQPRHFLPFDIDGFDRPESFTQVREWLGRFKGFAYTTASSTPEAPRCRVVLAQMRATARDEGIALCVAIQSMIERDLGSGRVAFDESVYKAEQPLFTPITNAETFHFTGTPVNVDAILADAPAVEDKRTTTSSDRAETIAAADPVLSSLKLAGMVKQDLGNGKIAVVCPCADEPTSDSSETATVYFLPNFGGVKHGKFHCLHDHCRDRRQEQFLEALGLVPLDVWREQAEGTTTPADENEELRREVDALAAMPLLKYERTYKDHAKRLGIRAAVLDKLVQVARSGASEEGEAMFPDVEPWPSPVDAATLLSDLSAGFRRYAVLPTHADDALALWCAFTWFCEVSHIAPLLVIRSPEKGCGKSTVLSIIKRLVYRPWALSGISAAVLFRVADRSRPTVLIDEGDTFLNAENQDLHGIINSGYSKDAPYFWRCVGDDHEPKGFYVFSPKAIAFIGHTRDTLHDRAVEVELRRKMSHEKVARLRHADGGELDTLARKLARLAADNIAAYAAMRPTMPESLPDRQADNWEPLFSIAHLAGDEWVQRATVAALALTGSKALSAPVSVGVELLADIQHVFECKRVDKIRTADLLQALCDDPEAAWATYNRGKQISPRQVAKRLAEYSIRPKTIRCGHSDTPKGYELEQFAEAFARYLSTPSENAISSATVPQPNVHKALSVAVESCIRL